jgi:hypothetical protein
VASPGSNPADTRRLMPRAPRNTLGELLVRSVDAERRQLAEAGR